MNVSSVSGANANQQSGGVNVTQVRTDFEQLASALSSGNLDQAQQAFSTLANDAPGLLQNSPASSGLNAVGEALQSGNIGAAQNAFAALQQAAQSHRHHHHHLGGSSQQIQPSESTPSADTTDGAGTVIDKFA